MPPVLAFAGLVIGAVGGAVIGVGSAIAGAGFLGGLGGLVGGALINAGIGLSLTGVAISAGGIAGALTLAKFAMNTSAIIGLIGGTPAVGGAAGSISPIDFKAEAHAPIPYMIGRSAAGGWAAAMLCSNDTQHSYLHVPTILSGCGPIEEFESFKSGEETVAFSGDAATTSPFAGLLWQSRTLGPTSSWSMPQPSGTGSIPEWTSAHKLTGYAAVHQVYKADPNVYPGGRFEAPIWVCKWVKVYDPRLDDTYPGGSGDCRADDEATWAWSANPFLHGLTWCIGRHQNGVLVMGIGAPIAGIDVAAFVDGANVCDANGWEANGGVTSADDKMEVLFAMLQAGGGLPLPQGAKISCLVQKPRVAIAAFSDADLAGACSRPKQARRRDRFNQVICDYVSEAHNWQTVSADPYKVDAYIAAEGRRSRKITFPMVTDPTQVTQLGAYAIYDSHEVPDVQVPVTPRWMGLQRGDLVSGYLTPIGVEMDLLVLERRVDPQTLAVSLLCRSENVAKHALALGLTGTAPPAPTTTRPLIWEKPAAPLPGYWAASGGTAIEGANAGPFLTITGTPADCPRAEDVVFEYRRLGDTDWTAMPPGLVSAGVRTSTQFGLVSESRWDVAVSYRVRGITGDRLVMPDIQVGSLIFSGADPTDGAIIVDTTVTGAGEFTLPWSGEIDYFIWGGGGSPIPPGYVPDGKEGEYLVVPAFGGGAGGYSAKVAIPVEAGDTLTWNLGATVSTCAGMTVYRGGDGDYSAGGVGGTASGGDINVTGHAGGLTNWWDGGGAWNPTLAAFVDQGSQGFIGTTPAGGGSGSAAGSSGGGQPPKLVIIYRAV